MARVAVIIPTFNRPRLLERAVRSVQLQAVPPHEVIVVNDGTEPIPQMAGVKVVKSGGGEGCAKARNLAFSHLSPETDAIGYLDDDDELLPEHVQLLSEQLDMGHEFVFSKAVYRYLDGSSTEDPEPGNMGPKRYYDPNALLEQNIAPVSSFMHTRKAFVEVGGFDTSIMRLEDWDMWGRMFIRFGPPAFVDKATNAIYKGLGDNMTDSSAFNYSLCCSWRDIVSDRLKHLAAEHRWKPNESDTKRFHVPRVGVVLPVFNAEKWLAECMESVLGQTYSDFEVLAVNDRSTDGSREILERYAIMDPRVRIFDTPVRSGVSKALNLGLLVSRSELVARMDADDVCEKDRFRLQVEFLDANKGVAIVGSRFLSMDETLNNVIWDNHDIPTESMDVAAELLKRCCIGHPTVMMRRKVVETIGGYGDGGDCRAVEDYDLWLRASKRFKIANLPLSLLKHRTHGRQVSREMEALQMENAEKIRKKHASS